MKTLSVVISAYNEEKKIERTLKSVSWANEIIVVDNESTDRTAAIALKLGAKVFTQANNSMLNKNKNFGFSKASSDWILNLDADEIITEELAKEIQQRLKELHQNHGFWIARKNIIFGKWIQHGLWWPDKQLRLFDKNFGSFPCEHVHEYLNVQGDTSALLEPMVHYNYETISQFIQKLDHIYTENEVAIKKKTYVFHKFDVIRFPLSDFVKIYFAQEGYKDGLHGLVLALLQSVYSIIVYAKLWEQLQFPEKEISLDELQKEGKNGQHEISYWFISLKINRASSNIKKIYYRLLRKYV